jgi:Fur family ferric uptake transcriptional regulator
MAGSMQPSQPEENVKAGDRLPPLEQACSRLKAAGLRVTKPRRSLLAALLAEGEPATIGELHDAVGVSRCDQVTLYRSLAAFAEIGLVRRTLFPDRVSRYEFDQGQAERYRVVSAEPQRSATLDEPVETQLRRAVEAAEAQLKARGYTGVTHRVEFFGTAPADEGEKRLAP